MAGSDASFDPGGFRSAIKATMQMGVPTDLNDRLVWHFRNITSYPTQDPALKPYDWTVAPTFDVPSDPDLPTGEHIVDYALEFARSTPQESEVGAFDATRLVVTLLDVDYEQIKQADYATIGRVHYDIDYTGPPMGLFEVTVYQVFLTARDQA